MIEVSFNNQPHAPFAWYQSRMVRRDQLWYDVQHLAAQLPAHAFVFNLCENRYRFCVALLAAALRGQITLLPPSKQSGIVRELHSRYPDAYLLNDQAIEGSALSCIKVMPQATETGEMPVFDWLRTAVIAFTSGSTGQPKACIHNLQTFAVSAKLALDALQWTDKAWLMLATTPAQHMYGLETSVFWPLCSDLILHEGRPFFISDVIGCIEHSPWPTVLASTPTHLQSLIGTDTPWPRLAGVLSATDRLSPQLSRDLYQQTKQWPKEIYGSTETLSFAYRDHATQRRWQPYAKTQLVRVRHEVQLQAPHLPHTLAINDRVRIDPCGQFTVLGRSDDLLKIAGKRSSLAELEHRLREIEGVEDGFCAVQTEQTPPRIVAVVVSQLSKTSIRQALAQFIDPVFLPRKIVYVNEIPRNDTGKLTRPIRHRLLFESGVLPLSDD